MGVSTAIVVTPDLPSPINEAFARGEHLGFSNIITITEQFNTRNFGLTPLDFGGILGFEERHYELNVFEDRIIRSFDLLLLFFSLPILVSSFVLLLPSARLERQRFLSPDTDWKGAVCLRCLNFERWSKMLIKCG
jgi:hypothetical protein